MNKVAPTLAPSLAPSFSPTLAPTRMCYLVNLCTASTQLISIKWLQVWLQVRLQQRHQQMHLLDLLLSHRLMHRAMRHLGRHQVCKANFNSLKLDYISINHHSGSVILSNNGSLFQPIAGSITYDLCQSVHSCTLFNFL